MDLCCGELPVCGVSVETEHPDEAAGRQARCGCGARPSLLLEAVGIVVSMCKYLEEDDTAMMQTFFVTGGADSLEQLLALGGSSFWPCYW